MRVVEVDEEKEIDKMDIEAEEKWARGDTVFKELLGEDNDRVKREQLDTQGHTDSLESRGNL